MADWDSIERHQDYGMPSASAAATLDPYPLVVRDATGHLAHFPGAHSFVQHRSGTLEIQRDGELVGIFAAGGWIYVGRG